MIYKALVDQITCLRWDRASRSDLFGLMMLNAHAAREFASSVRICCRVHPDSLAFQEMAEGELEADNLEYEDYKGPGDHFKFLKHFINKYEVYAKCSVEVERAAQTYERSVMLLPAEIRIMSVVSREQELPGIFKAILEAPGFDSHPALKAFKYYLERHIELDSGEGGHADLLSGFPVSDEVVPFYELRLQMYRSLPRLWPQS